MTKQPIEIVVTPRLQNLFGSAVIQGKGGYQSLCRLLQRRLITSDRLSLSANELRRVVRYSAEYARGGFQAHMRELVTLFVYQHLDTLVPEGPTDGTN
jgi:hypothetical protein